MIGIRNQQVSNEVGSITLRRGWNVIFGRRVCSSDSPKQADLWSDRKQVQVGGWPCPRARRAASRHWILTIRAVSSCLFFLVGRCGRRLNPHGHHRATGWGSWQKGSSLRVWRKDREISIWNCTTPQTAGDWKCTAIFSQKRTQARETVDLVHTEVPGKRTPVMKTHACVMSHSQFRNLSCNSMCSLVSPCGCNTVRPTEVPIEIIPVRGHTTKVGRAASGRHHLVGYHVPVGAEPLPERLHTRTAHTVLVQTSLERVAPCASTPSRNGCT